VAGREGSGDPGREAGQTRVFGARPEGEVSCREVLLHVYRALQEKGYDPIGQIAHYLLSGEPTYITGHQHARTLITRLERDEILAELVRSYIAHLTGEDPVAGRR